VTTAFALEVPTGKALPSAYASTRGGEMGKVITVYIVADFEPMRSGLVKAVSGASDMQVVGEASTLQEMAQETGQADADILVVDMQTLEMTDRDVMYERLREWVPAIKVCFLGSNQEAAAIRFESVPQAMTLDTVGFLFKNGPAERIIQGIRLIAGGVFVCEIEVIRNMLTRLSKWANDDAENQPGRLSERETEVLVAVAQGRSNKEIAMALFVSEGTVKAHISHIMNKLGVGRRTELVRYALSKSLVSFPEE